MIRKNKSVIIVIHEIYGLNEHINKVCESLQTHDFDVICPNLLKREPFDYSESDIAYEYFIEEVGFTIASERIKELLVDIKRTYDKVFIVGFSVGATIAWLCSEVRGVDGIVGYYGSRIRDYAQLSPACPTLLFFADEEKSFKVDDLIAKLVNKQIEVLKLHGQHGFSDPYSSRYNEESAQKAFNEMLHFLVTLS